jgi:SAM-dependent methyltransferase
MHAEVQRYYGEVLSSTDDLKTSACCTADAPPQYLRDALGQIHDEVLTRYYGCGLVLPEALDGADVLDLGCGAGRDVYVLSQLAGADGFVVGVDMTSEQLDVARRHRDYHAEQFGHPRSNVEFIEGNIERLGETGLTDGRFDVIVSNCVINLATDKQAVLDDAWRLLKPGGELYFADIYADRRIPAELQADPVLYGECLSGALYWNDFLNIARRAGFSDPRLVVDRPLDVTDEALAALVGDIRFFSATYRLFKLPELEAANEDYGQTARYRGTLPHHPERLVFDKTTVFETGIDVPVGGNTARMLTASRLARHFDVHGNNDCHAGPFDDGRASGIMPFEVDEKAAASGCC